MIGIPLRDKVLIQRGEEVRTTKGGIYIPENAAEKQTRGTIIAIGLGAFNNEGKRIKPEVAVGDEVLFSKYSGVEVDIDGDKYIVMSESEIAMRFPRE